MAIPKWAQQHMQQKIDEGSLNHNDLGDTARGLLRQPKPPEYVGMGDLRREDVINPPSGMGSLREYDRVEPESNIGTSFQKGIIDRADTMYGGFTPPAGTEPNPWQLPDDSVYTDEEAVRNYSPQGTAENIAYGAGGMVSDLPLFVTGQAAIGNPVTSALIPRVGNVLARTAGATATGAGIGGVEALAEGQPLPEALKTVGTSAAMWGGTELGLQGLGAGFKAFAKTGTPKIENLDLTVPAPERPSLIPFKTGTQGYAINNARDFGRGRDFSSVPDNPYPSNYLGSPARSGVKESATEAPIINVPDPIISRPGPKVLRPPDYAKQSMEELQAGITEAQNYVQHNDILAAYPPGTTIQQAYADIRANTGIDIPQLMANAEKAMARPGLRQTAEQQAQFARLRMAAGLGPERIGRTGQPPRTLGKMDVQTIEQKYPLPFQRTPEPEAVMPKPFERQSGGFASLVKQGQKDLPPVMPEVKLIPPKVDPKSGPTSEIKPDDVTNLKDLGGWRLYMTDVYRNFKDTFGSGYEKVKAEILDPFDASKKASIQNQENWLTGLKTEVVDRLGIQKGSKESALVQDFGEKKITLEQLKQMRPSDWQKIVEADQWFRRAYDQLIDEVNASRKVIYPKVEGEMAKIDAKIEAIKNAPRMKGVRKEEEIKKLVARKEEIFRNKFVPKREDYYRHFREMTEGFAGLKNIFDSPAQISSGLSGISEYTLPKSKWASFMQKRSIGPYKSDAVGGFLNYLPAASHAIHIDPHIGKFEKLADDLAAATEKTGNLNNFIEYLRDFSRDLAGKTNPVDRFVQKVIPGGRAAFRAIDWLNNRVKANVILGNLASALSQIANVPQGIAFAKQYSAPGAGRALKSIFVESQPMKSSGFLKERYGGTGSAMYRQFDTGLLQQPKNFAIWMMETADKVGTTFIWNSAYSKALAQKAANPIMYADNVTRRMVAGRGVGEVPLIQKSKLFQLVAPFQLEVGNLWSVMRDFTKEKDFSALVILAVGSWVMNRGIEATRGSGVSFDPIQAMIEAMGEDMTPLQRGGRLAGEFLSNVPLGQTVASLYPEYGTTVFGNELPTRDKFFGRADPTRFGSGLLVAKAIDDPLYKMALPFGGNQLKKTIGGIKAVDSKGVYTPDGGQLKYPVSTDPVNTGKGVIFGPGAFKEAQPYFRANNRPLSEKDTEALRRMGNPQSKYNTIQFKRDVEAVEREISDVRKDKKLTPQERIKKIQELAAKKNRLIQKRGN